jgi:hypothetical protein
LSNAAALRYRPVRFTELVPRPRSR